ncbi:hypothetical protein Tco_0128377 [Tanacetum coccineum]
MDITKAEQIALDDALVAPANRLKIGKCNLRLSSDLKSKEVTLQVVYDVLKLTPFYKAFQASADVPEIYMQEEMLQICPKIRNQKFDEPPFEQEILTFLVSLGHSGEIRKITDVNVNKLHQPWRSFAAVINKCLSGKSSYDSLCLSQVQIIWGMYHKKNVDYAFLLWEDFTYQVENKNTEKVNVMYYPRFTKLIVNFFMSKDPSIPRRNKINWHYARDDPMFTIINVISRHKDTQLEVPPKTKASVHKKKANYDTTPKEKLPIDPKDKRVKQTGKMIGSGKQKQPTTGLETLSDIALTETEQLKIAIKRSRIQTHSSQASGSGDGVDTLLKVPDEQVYEKTGTDEGAGDKPEVPDVPEHHSNNDDGDNITHPKLSTFSTDDQEEQDDEEEQEDDDEDEEEIYDQLVRTASDYQTSDESEKQKDDDRVKNGEEDKEGDVTNVALEGGDVDMTKADTTEDMKDAHVTLTAATPVVQQQSSYLLLWMKLKQSNPFTEAISFISGIVNEYLGSKMKEAVDVAIQLKSNKLREEAQAKNQAFLNSLDSNMQKIIKDQVKTQTSKIKSKVEKYVTESLGAEVLIRSTNQPQTSYGIASSLSELELKRILMDKMEENKSIDRSDVQKNLYNALVEAYNTDKDLLSSYGDVLIIPRTKDDKDKDEEPFTGSNRGTKRRRSTRKLSHSKNQLVRRAGQQVLRKGPPNLNLPT